MERGLRESRAVETESLCIVAGEQVWRITVDVTVIDDCGNAIDAAALAALAAVVHFKRPHVDVIGDRVTVHSMEAHEPDPLAVHHRPVSVSFALAGERGEHIVLDPTLKEEAVVRMPAPRRPPPPPPTRRAPQAVGAVHVALNAHRELCGLFKPGGMPISPEHLAECLVIANAKAADLSAALSEALKADREAREAGTWRRGVDVVSLAEMSRRRASEAEP